MIRVNNLHYQYQYGEQKILKSVSFTVNPGEIVGLVGQNGAGKSTVGKLVAGIIQPPKNTVFIDDIDVGRRRNFASIFQKIGIVFQNPETQIIFNDVYEEMRFAGAKTGVSDSAIRSALETVGMLDKVGGELWDFSPGQKQRIVFAETLARQPQYLVLDEPTTMVDPAGKLKLRAIIRRLKKRGIGILLITNAREEMRLADRILTLVGGRIAT